MPAPPCIYRYENVSSTNDLAHELARSGAPHLTTVTAIMQTGGRGQRGRSFHSPTGGLYCSFVLRPKQPLQYVPMITITAGIACCRMIQKYYPSVLPKLKWPNDVYLGKKKVAGLLAEGGAVTGSSINYVILGLGLNVNSEARQFPFSLHSRITSLYDVTSLHQDLDKMLYSFITLLSDSLDENNTAAVNLTNAFSQFDLLCGQPMRYRNPGSKEELYGTGLGIGTDGCYRLLLADGREKQLLAGDVSPLFNDEHRLF